MRPLSEIVIDQASLEENKIWVFTDMKVSEQGIAMFNFTVKFAPKSYRQHITWGDYLENKSSSYKYYSQQEALDYGLIWSKQYV